MKLNNGRPFFILDKPRQNNDTIGRAKMIIFQTHQIIKGHNFEKMMEHLVSAFDDENHHGGDVDDDAEASQDQDGPTGNLSDGRHCSGQLVHLS